MTSLALPLVIRSGRAEPVLAAAGELVDYPARATRSGARERVDRDSRDPTVAAADPDGIEPERRSERLERLRRELDDLVDAVHCGIDAHEAVAPREPGIPV